MKAKGFCMGGFKIDRISTILLSVTALAGFVLTRPIPAAKADNTAVSFASITISSTCSLTANVDVAHSATLINGAYSGGSDYYPDGIGKTTITAFCNNSAGFAIYAVGYSGEPGTYGNNTLIGTQSANHFIRTGTATTGDTSEWAMKITKVTDATAYSPESLTITNDFDSYHAVPDDYTKVAQFTSTTDETLGSKFTTTYAVYASPTQVADTYTGQVKYTLIHPQDAPAPSVLNEYDIFYLQDFAGLTSNQLTTIKNAMRVGRKAMLTDIRDKKTYNIAKLADGNIWLLDNLALDLTDPVIVNGLSSDNTNASNVSLGYLKNGGGSTSDRYPISGLTYSDWVSNGDYYNYSYSRPLLNTLHKDTVFTDDIIDDASSWKYGIYYNYCAISAGSYCFGSDRSSGDSSGDSNEDICPKGWRMPSSNEYNSLYTGSSYSYGNPTTYRTAFRLPYPGQMDRGVASNQGERGSYWTRDRRDDGTMYLLYVTNSTVSANSNLSRYSAFPARCILDPTSSSTIEGVTYLQDVTDELVNNTPISTIATLKDKRDNTSYTVGKLADGRLWLLDNLALDLTNQTVVNNMNSTNTNASDATLNYLKNGGGASSDKYAASGLTYSDWVSGYSYSKPMVNTLSKNSVFAEDALSGASTWKYGIYYNYCAVTAGSYCYGSDTDSGSPSDNATEDICPKGWHLPTTSSGGEYSNLYNNASYGYNTTDTYRTALRLPLSGVINNGEVSSQGSTGYWATATKRDNIHISYLRVGSSSGVNTALSDGHRLSGVSTRCIYGS